MNIRKLFSTKFVAGMNFFVAGWDLRQGIVNLMQGDVVWAVFFFVFTLMLAGLGALLMSDLERKRVHVER